jgi:hypothetical protein
LSVAIGVPALLLAFLIGIGLVDRIAEGAAGDRAEE